VICLTAKQIAFLESNGHISNDNFKYGDIIFGKIIHKDTCDMDDNIVKIVNNTTKVREIIDILSWKVPQ